MKDDAFGPIVDLSIHTRRPSKWVIVDTETRQMWKWNANLSGGMWVLASLADLQLSLQAESHPCRGCDRKYDEHPAPDCETWY